MNKILEYITAYRSLYGGIKVHIVQDLVPFARILFFSVLGEKSWKFVAPLPQPRVGELVTIQGVPLILFFFI